MLGQIMVRGQVVSMPVIGMRQLNRKGRYRHLLSRLFSLKCLLSSGSPLGFLQLNLLFFACSMMKLRGEEKWLKIHWRDTHITMNVGPRTRQYVQFPLIHHYDASFPVFLEC